MRKRSKLKAGAVNAPPIPQRPAVQALTGTRKRCCKIPAGAVEGAVNDGNHWNVRIICDTGTGVTHIFPLRKCPKSLYFKNEKKSEETYPQSVREEAAA